MNRDISLRMMGLGLIGLGLLCFASLLAERNAGGDRPLVIACGLFGLASMLCAALGQFRPTEAVRRKTKDRLDRVLLYWDQSNPFTVRDLLSGGVAIFGRTGSGKTSSSGKAIARSLVHLPGSGGLIIAAKPGEDRAMWQRIFRDAGREQDLLVFAPDSPLRFNFLDYEMRHGGHTRNITRTLTTIGETLRSGSKESREDGGFWSREQERVIFNAVEVVKLATGRVTAPDLHRFISGAAMSPQHFSSEEWLGGFHNRCLKAAWEMPKSTIAQHDFELAKEFWLGEFPNMADKTRSSVLVGVMGILHAFNTGMVRELVSTHSNVSPDDLFTGTFIMIDMPVSEWSDIGKFIIGGWKYLVQKAILSRVSGPDTNVVAVWADEAQTTVTSFDQHFLAQCRSHHGCMVYLSQSLPGYISAIGGEHAKSSVESLMAGFSTKVFHALGDLETAQMASALVGRSLQTFTGGSMTPSEGVYDDLMGQSRYSGNFSQSFESTLQINAFLHGLRTGGAANNFLCDAYVLRSGEPFANGENHLLTSFSQKGAGS